MPFIFIFSPVLRTIALYIIAAVLPAAFLMRYIYRKDPIEKEPRRLLAALVIMGVLAALAAIGLERIGKNLLAVVISETSPYYTIAFAFLVVAVIEEGTKFIFLGLRTWNSREFDHRFDGVVYAVFVSLGFAAFENITYVFVYGLSVALPRALLAIPAHMGFAVFMGSFYGRARVCASRRRTAGTVLNLLTGYLAAVFLHGLYDTCAMLGTTLSTIIFYAFVAFMYIIVILLIKKETRSDRPI